MKLICSKCKVQECDNESGPEKFPAYCPMASDDRQIHAELERSKQRYLEDEATRHLALAAARTEAAGYLKWPRAQEVMDFAWRIGAGHIGIAHCVGLANEAGLFQEILENNSFQVSSACCKVGVIDKLDLGMTPEETLCPEGFNAMCNPVGQAYLLALAQTDLNVLVGLCVGHDTLFMQNSKTPATVLIAKDRVPGHNPAAALYNSHSYFKRLQNINH